jgi:tryptophan-rich sensory protein
MSTVSAEHHRFSRSMLRGFGRDMFVSGILPWIAVLVLERYGVPLVSALALSTIFPVVDGTVSLVRKHRLDAIGLVNLSFIIGSIVALGSLLAPKPLMFFLGRQFSTGDDKALIAEWNARWDRPQFRTIIRIITAVWGVGYAIEVIARVTAAYTLPPLVVLATAPFITYGVLALLIAWTIAYSSAMRQKYAAYLERAQALSS